MYGIMVEGAAEKAIIDILFENDYLMFGKDDVVENGNELVYDKLNPDKYIKNYLYRDFDESIEMIVVCDSFEERNFDKSNQVEKVLYFVTRQEIEAIHLYKNRDWPEKYKSYKKHNRHSKGGKPSSFFKDNRANGGLEIKNVKNYNYVYNLWKDDVQGLVCAIISVAHEMIRKKCFSKYSSQKFRPLALLLREDLLEGTKIKDQFKH